MIPAVTSGLYYGTGCFETFVCVKGNIFKFNKHIERLNNGIDFLGISCDKFVKVDDILLKIRGLLKKNSLLGKTARVRIQISLNEKSGYSNQNDTSFIAIITSQPVGNKKPSQKLVLADTRVIPSTSKPAELKLSNMLHYRRAFREAEQEKADDAVMLTINSFIAETSIANIFWKKGKEIFTPSEDCDILPGIMRNSIIEILDKKMNYHVNEGKYRFIELIEADHIWITNSVIDFIPVSKIEGNSYSVETPFFDELNKELESYKEEHMINV